MKTKKFHKRLTLNKKTIADLSNGQLVNVKGGCLSMGERSCGTETCYIPSCDTCYETCNNTCPETCNDRTCYTCGIYCIWPVFD